MYWNDTHILIYFFVAILGGIIGQFIDYLDKTFVEGKKIFSKKSFKKYKINAKQKYSLILLNAFLYIALLYKLGFGIDFLRFAPLATMLICAFIIDYQVQIIPNRLNLTMFEVRTTFCSNIRDV